ncbi:regulator of G-protein signaling egl-10-like isoform X1 [Rhopalosiphum maidis]|uniref:regulator of G-protein signaling egl-10-like isoform X1 n=1 Tax=Rhopalosiphum maidis TaxID=43146 RepID=UPI000EFE044A|nr:regulator of G-protein signaling egl-10-like isoform X1 [Rhopalosiphum maidis]
MLRFIKKPLISLFKIIKRWITRQSASNGDLSISFTIGFLDNGLSIDSLMKLQDITFDEILPNPVVKKLKREYVEMLNHIINIKVSDLINRMNNKVERIPLNTIIKSAKLIFPRIQMKGSSLILWFINTMDFNQDEAQYMANLLSSHIIVFTIVNHYLTLLNVGCFYRKKSSSSQITYKTHLNDYDYAIYLCKREIEENLNGDLLNYKVKKSAKAKVDFNIWEFEFQLADDKSKTCNNNPNDKTYKRELQESQLQ